MNEPKWREYIDWLQLQYEQQAALYVEAVRRGKINPCLPVVPVETLREKDLAQNLQAALADIERLKGELEVAHKANGDLLVSESVERSYRKQGDAEIERLKGQVKQPTGWRVPKLGQLVKLLGGRRFLDKDTMVINKIYWQDGQLIVAREDGQCWCRIGLTDCEPVEEAKGESKK